MKKTTRRSHPRRVKTAADVLTIPESMQHTKVKLRKVEALSLSFISSLLIILCSIVGCSDMPYTGSMMTTDTVDEYIVSPNDELVCLQNSTDSECLTLIPKDTGKVDSTNGPIIHIHPEKLVYVFYHKGEEIIRAEKIMDTTEIVETLTETKTDPALQTDDPPDDTGTAGNNPSANNNPGGTPNSLPQIDDPPDDIDTAGDDSADDNNPDDHATATTNRRSVRWDWHYWQ